MRKHNNATASSQQHRHTSHNAPYRAELVGILGALQQGYPSIMTDSVNSVHAIRAAMYYPAQIRVSQAQTSARAGKNRNNDHGRRNAAI
jgi:hypothetical protein